MRRDADWLLDIPLLWRTVQGILEELRKQDADT